MALGPDVEVCTSQSAEGQGPSGIWQLMWVGSVEEAAGGVLVQAGSALARSGSKALCWGFETEAEQILFQASRLLPGPPSLTRMEQLLCAQQCSERLCSLHPHINLVID